MSAVHNIALTAELTAIAELDAIAAAIVATGIPDDHVELVNGRRVWHKHGLRDATELVARLLRDRDNLIHELHQRTGGRS